MRISGKKKNIKFVDLFAGIGGFHIALKNVARINDYDIECVFVSEIDKEAKKTYSINFNFDESKMINIRDIDSKASQVPTHDFLFAGFPCQTFSNAGKKQGFLDEIRGTLFFDIAKILENKKPKYILLENVKHLVNHDNGRTWDIIIDTLQNKLGYIIPEKPLILSPEEFGIPQDRKRVFIPGILREKTKYKGKYLNIEFPSKNNKKENYQEIKRKIFDNYLEKNVDQKFYLKNHNNGNYLNRVFNAWEEFLINVKWKKDRTLPVIWTYEFNKNYEINSLPQWKQKYILDIRDLYKLNKKFIDKWMIKHDVHNWNKREQKFEWQAGLDITSLKDSFIQLRQSGIRCKRPIKFPTLVAIVQIPLIYDENINEWRYLTPRETANLQSFPASFKTHSDITKNNVYYSYKQFGNSVNVKIVEFIQNYLLKNY